MRNSENDTKIDLETLLRLKRVEMPRPEFWSGFDSELRVKQLAAIVRREPWWRQGAKSIFGNARIYLPVSFAALVIVTFVGIRGKPRSMTSPVARSIPAREAFAGAQPAPAALVAIAAENFAPPAAENVRVPATAEDLPGKTPVASEISDLLLATGGSTLASPVPHSENVFAAGVSDNVDLPSLDASEFPKVLPVSASAEPLLRMESPADRRRSRLLASSLPTVGMSPVLANDRVASRLSDDRLTEEAIRRIGARGDRVLVKF